MGNGALPNGLSYGAHPRLYRSGPLLRDRNQSLLHIPGCLPKPLSTRCSLLESPSFHKVIRWSGRPMKTGITKLNQLQVVVALLAFGLLAGASGSAAAAVGIEGQVQASGSPLPNSTVTLWQANARALR